MSRVLIVRASDGLALERDVRERLRDEPVQVEAGLAAAIDPWEPIVVLVLLSPGALNEAEVSNSVALGVRQGLPLVPVVEDFTRADFATWERVLPDLGMRNAVAVYSDGGAALLEAVRGYLGLEAFAKDRKVFISYRRTDGESVAQEIYEYLWRQHFEVFLDRYQIEPGAIFQERITQEIARMDFVLLIDSPDAGRSKWVEAEITEALNRRVPVCRLCLTPEELHMPLYPEGTRLAWDPQDERRLEKLRLIVSRAIAARQSHEQRVWRTIRSAIEGTRAVIRSPARRQWLLMANDAPVLVESEREPPSLERLYRLYCRMVEFRCAAAILVAGDRPLTRLTQKSVEWARGSARLEVVPLVHLYALVKALFR